MVDSVKAPELPTEDELLECASYASLEYAQSGRGCVMIGFQRPHLATHPWMWIPAAAAGRFNLPSMVVTAIDQYKPATQAVIVVMTAKCLKLVIVDVSSPVPGAKDMN